MQPAILDLTAACDCRTYRQGRFASGNGQQAALARPVPALVAERDELKERMEKC